MRMKDICPMEKVLVLQSKTEGPTHEWRDRKILDSFEELDKELSSGRYDLRGYIYRVIVRYVVFVDVGLVDNDYCWEGGR